MSVVRTQIRRVLAAVAAAGFIACGSSPSTTVTGTNVDGGQDGTTGTSGSSGSSHSGSSLSSGSSNSGSSGTVTTGSSDAGGSGTKDGGGPCNPPETTCGTGATATCANLSTDPTNCGKCGTTCPAELPMCSDGKCGIVCTGNNVSCPGVSLDAGKPEDAGKPKDAGKEPDGSASEGRDAGSNSSAPYCANPANDPKNCGGCNIICPFGENSTASCAEGKCVLNCSEGYSNCDNNPANGCEIATATNPDNCGTCGKVCTSANGTPTCTAGVCGTSACAAGFANCSGSGGTGCQTPITTPQNCGACGNICPSGPNSTPECNNMLCALQCAQGYANCNGMPSTGCQVNINTSVANCGSCGNVCNLPNATPECTNGQCEIASCNSGYADCDMKPSNGCEVDTNTDPNNCSACGRVCMTANGTPSCMNGVCGIGMCNAGYQNCSGNPANGCNVDTNTDVNNCGGCGNTCAGVENATAICTNGSCSFTTCNAGYGNCDGILTNGCETSLTSVTNCGACGTTCSTTNGTPECSTSTNPASCAEKSCNAGFANCPGDGNNCSTATSSDDNNCGGCGIACNNKCEADVTATKCVNSVCEVATCTAGFVDFDGLCADGCECPVTSALATETNCTTASTIFAGSLGTGNVAQITSTLINATAPYTTNAQEAFFTVTFGAAPSAWTAANHPKISLTSTSGEFVMDVLSSCAGTAQSTEMPGGVCQDTGASSVGTNTQVWEEQYGSTWNPGTSANTPIPAVGEVWIRVYRNTADTATCDTFTLTASD